MEFKQKAYLWILSVVEYFFPINFQMFLQNLSNFESILHQFVWFSIILDEIINPLKQQTLHNPFLRALFLEVYLI